MPVQILSHSEIQSRLKRMAFQIYEAHFSAEALWLVGIQGHGNRLAGQLGEMLRAMAPFSVDVLEFPREGAQPLPLPPDARIVIVDDVIHTGASLYRALAACIPAKPQSVKVAILVDRGHRLLPIHADFVGLELATTLHEYVQVSLDNATQTLSASLA